MEIQKKQKKAKQYTQNSQKGELNNDFAFFLKCFSFGKTYKSEESKRKLRVIVYSQLLHPFVH